MNKAKVLEATAPPGVTVTPVPADHPTPDPRPLGVPIEEFKKALGDMSWGFTYKELRELWDSIFDYSPSEIDIDD